MVIGGGIAGIEQKLTFFKGLVFTIQASNIYGLNLQPLYQRPSPK
jgi:hypothetical protein